jgi:hypothetical protein
MRHRTCLIAAALVAVGVLSAACARSPDLAAATEEASSDVAVEAVPGTELSRVTLTEVAVERLGITTAPVRETPAPGHRSSKVVAYAAVLYDAAGLSWVYTSPEPRTYVREPITVERVDGDLAYLRDGPKAGTAVVTVGVAELFGAEYGVGGE